MSRLGTPWNRPGQTETRQTRGTATADAAQEAACRSSPTESIIRRTRSTNQEGGCLNGNLAGPQGIPTSGMQALMKLPSP